MPPDSPFSIGGGIKKGRTKTESERQLEREVETSKRPTRQFMRAFDILGFMGNLPSAFGFGTLGRDQRFNQALTGLEYSGEPTELETRRGAQAGIGGGGFSSPYMNYADMGLAQAMATGQAAMPAGMGIGEAPIVVTQAEYDALPPGSSYQGEDGKIYQKPGGAPGAETGAPDTPEFESDYLEQLLRGVA